MRNNGFFRPKIRVKYVNSIFPSKPPKHGILTNQEPSSNVIRPVGNGVAFDMSNGKNIVQPKNSPLLNINKFAGKNNI